MVNDLISRQSVLDIMNAKIRELQGLPTGFCGYPDYYEKYRDKAIEVIEELCGELNEIPVEIRRKRDEKSS